MIAKTLAGTAVAASLALGLSGAAITPAAADPGAFIAGAIGGTALGVVAGSALAGPRYYAPAPVEYVGPAPSCWFERRPVLDPYGYVVGYRRTRVCE